MLIETLSILFCALESRNSLIATFSLSMHDSLPEVATRQTNQCSHHAELHYHTNTKRSIVL